MRLRNLAFGWKFGRMMLLKKELGRLELRERDFRHTYSESDTLIERIRAMITAKKSSARGSVGKTFQQRILARTPARSKLSAKASAKSSAENFGKEFRQNLRREISVAVFGKCLRQNCSAGKVV